MERGVLQAVVGKVKQEGGGGTLGIGAGGQQASVPIRSRSPEESMTAGRAWHHRVGMWRAGPERIILSYMSLPPCTPWPSRRPSGIPEKDLRSTMVPYFLQQRDTLRQHVQKQEAKNRQLAEAVLAGRRQVEDLQLQVQARQQAWQVSVRWLLPQGPTARQWLPLSPDEASP